MSPKPRDHEAVRGVPQIGSDRAIVDAIRAGNREAVGVLFDRYAPHVRRVLGRVLGADQELADLVQEVFMQAMRAIDKLQNADSVKQWLTSMAVFAARGRIRRRRRKRWLRLSAPEEFPEIEAPYLSHEVREAVRCTYQVMELLPDEERMVFALRVIDSMEVADISDACGISPSTVKRRIARAEARFAKLARQHPVLRDWLRRDDP